MTKYKPYFDDEGNRDFFAKKRVNDKGTREVIDIEVRSEKDVRRDGKYMHSLLLFALTKEEAVIVRNELNKVL